MFTFYGQDCGTVDDSGRFKLSAGFCRELRRGGNTEVVLFGLPEGGIGVYPPVAWEGIQEQLITPAKNAAASVAARRALRLYCSQAYVTTLSRQGRLTMPANLREHAAIGAPGTIIQLGVGIGIELWSEERWGREFAEIKKHMAAKGERQMHADLRLTEVAELEE